MLLFILRVVFRPIVLWEWLHSPELPVGLLIAHALIHISRCIPSLSPASVDDSRGGIVIIIHIDASMVAVARVTASHVPIVCRESASLYSLHLRRCGLNQGPLGLLARHLGHGVERLRSLLLILCIAEGLHAVRCLANCLVIPIVHFR